MRESYGTVYLYNIILVFFAIIFAFIAGTLMYHKAFKVNSMISSSIEKYEGYNEYSIREIDNKLESYGYQARQGAKCPQKKGNNELADPVDEKYKYCIYNINADGKYADTTNYYSYGILTYIALEFPIINSYLQIPIYSESNRIYRFSNDEPIEEP